MNLKNISKLTIKTCLKTKEKLLFVFEINSDITHHDLTPNKLFSQMRVGQNALPLSLSYICPSAASVQCFSEGKMAAPVDNVSELCLDNCLYKLYFRFLHPIYQQHALC